MPHSQKSHYPGPDGLRSSILTDTPDDVPLLLFSLFNLSLKTYTFPDAWKCSTFHPRHKSGPPNIISNYRPICHISPVAKLLERIVNNALLAHLSSRSFFVAAQHGFLKRRSTTTCQLAFMDLVTSSIDAGKQTALIYLDIKKAFDRVQHSLLLIKLQQAGVEDPLLSWFRSYLSDRT